MIKSDIDNRLDRLSEVDQAWHDMYNDRFKDYFTRVVELDSKYRSKHVAISDADLESILTELPLTLFSISEALNQLRLEYEVLKLDNRGLKVKYREEFTDQANQSADMLINSGTKVSKSDMVRWIEDKTTAQSAQDEIIVKIYETVISRVENEVSFTKELIMAAKKLWDSRRSAESSNPVGEVTPELQDYAQINVGTYKAAPGDGSVPIGTSPVGTHPGSEYIK